ncbi:MAG: hypothetical protein AAGI17_05315 [Planctomycetota bacterium]
MAIRIGDLLVRRGLLTRNQRDEILALQKGKGGPFGVYAEELFGVSKADVEAAWSEQFASMADWIDPTGVMIDPELLGMLSSRQAWQFGVLPVRLDESELVCCTTTARLSRALRFTTWRIADPVRFELCEEHQLAEALETHLPMAGLDADFLEQSENVSRAS